MTPPDAAIVDAPAVDAAIFDAMAAPPSQEVVGTAGRVSGATYTVDVELGMSAGLQPVSGATYTVEGNAAIKP